MIHDTLTIRPFTEADIEAAERIENESFSNPWAKGSFDKVEKFPMLRGYCGEIDGTVCGFIIYSSLFEDAEILDIAVKGEYRRRGVARSLIEKMAETVLSLGAERILLEVRESNSSAESLYRSIGFRKIGVRRNYYSCPREDAIIMEKTIN